MTAAARIAPHDHQTMRDIARLLRIVHHIPGRVRLKLDWNAAGLGEALDDVGRFVRSVSNAAGIRSVNLNPLARSCTVEYDPTVISPAAWQDLVVGVRSAAADALLGALAACRG